jgi:hypothetical protein
LFWSDDVTVLGLEIFYELARIFYLLYYPTLLIEQDNLNNVDESMLATGSYLSLLSLCKLILSVFAFFLKTFCSEVASSGLDRHCAHV